MPCLSIERLDDPRLDDYRDVREADRLRRLGILLAEGEVVLRVLLARGRFSIRSLLLARPRAVALAPLLATLPEETLVYVVPQPLMERVVGFPIHRGVLASCQVGVPLDPVALLASLGPGPRRVVVLEGVVNHDNVGGIFRNCAAFGVDAVLLDAVSCDPLYRKAIRVSVGASLFVPFARCDGIAQQMAALRGAGFSIFALTPSTEALALSDLTVLPERVALLLGAEGPGLSEAALAGADHQVRIPMAPGFDSLNVATASGIALHHVFQKHLFLASG
ncbi:MAG: RNA methyltransferase [Myxococcales bacterium]|nr:RNA methyltransferase [Polyangiaceae bacterium]MDW8248143.1 RNA methyltransferase [Myxococcales bacterium]